VKGTLSMTSARRTVIVLASILVIALSSPARADDAKPRLPTLFIIGDSTVRNSTKGQQGWGTPSAGLFDKTQIKVENRALGGRSSRTFHTEGLWEKILAD